MNPAAAIAIIAATLNLSAAVVLAVISQAPGWRVARAFSAVALTAGLYSTTGAVFCLGGLAPETYQAVARGTYLAGHLNAVVWLVLAFGGPDASWQSMPRVVRGFAIVSLTLAFGFFVTGAHLQPAIDTVNVAWAGVQYHYPVATPLGEVYGFVVLLHYAVTCGALLRRLLRGERSELLQVLGFAVFFGLSVVELLVANRTIEFLSPGDVGMLIVVLPVSVRAVRRFVVDAERLNKWSGQLAGEVREQSEWRDRAQAALVESERMAALGRMAAGVGHEINDPLTYLTLSLGEVESHLRATDAPADVVASIGHAKDGATRIQKVAERLRTYSRRQDERVPLDLRDVVNAAVRVARPSLSPDIDVSFDLEAVPPILGDEPRLVQAVVNVLINAAQAVKAKPGAHAVRVTTHTNPLRESSISIHDDGEGVAGAHLSRLGEPYFTTRGDSGGLGLGLFVTRGVVDAHGGRLDIQSTPSHGTTVRLLFPGRRITPRPPDQAAAPAVAVPSEPAADLRPAHPGSPAAPPQPAQTQTPPERVGPPAAQTQPADRPSDTEPRPSVLIIDDEPLVSKLLAAILRKTWDVTVASSGAEALTALEGRRFDVLVCDLMMPGMSGIELAHELRRRDPEHRRRMLFLTGGAVTLEAEDFLARPDVRYLTKPIARPDLLTALDHTLALGRASENGAPVVA